ncbi:hypothetical protein DPMN_041436 [Dreissena polymorpha]|uniref:Uncharacterized protein n=1 Tax=Dreissena polymorpha TaxID=45954 RepID=A0A9D4CZB6_DREPO|nr:hypothetical protein DPMN_041436 [Dreissena polymorpha]
MCRTTGWQGDDSSSILVKTSSCTPHVLRGSVRSNPTVTPRSGEPVLNSSCGTLYTS